ncbi:MULTISPECIES: voltage-gated potassium channel protein [Acidithiobacillus]|uniref:Ion transport 2 domain protein n=1 Tax=Acidithiobacillus ferrivorans SS3 TaxID=743299 RepID=G0JL55_9PROT|nr:voltage-gated potassium channel protein [Acidithiobacillus ferrivorans]AEM49170.1 Ion transport 2 domain protein [Acidithiobacillus ferrivorans SS3]MBU2764979.1 voltage-gated potassium channel protein [Acidithiobacillus ferrivorans]MBU2849685.1 voltage-gated potassium channel protein [Acidithiobacillus ferrivorans]OFA15898.1 voltage-gated potassium channel [Acidithiobacillus ferrivorans]
MPKKFSERHPWHVLRPDWRVRWRVRGQRWANLLHLEDWYPHFPIAAAVGFLGIFNILPALEHLLGLSYVGSLAAVSHSFVLDAFRGIPQGAAGVILLIMSMGLLFRSRFAWALVLIMAMAILAFGIYRHPYQISVLLYYNAALVLFLWVFRGHFNRSSLATGTLFALVGAIMVVSYGVFGAYILGDGFKPQIHSLSTALYFSVVTMATVGYGDILPVSNESRLFVVSLIVLGITVFATSLSAIIVPAVNNRLQSALRGEKRRMIRKDHYIIAGDTPLARNSYRELRGRNLPVVVIMGHQPDDSIYQPEDLIIGDSSDTDVLRSAGAEQAAAVLALRADDSENAFVVLAVKEIEGSAKTVAAVNDSKNLGRVRRVQPDMIIAPQVLGGELLAMALNGEQLDSTAVMKMFRFSSGTEADKKG